MRNIINVFKVDTLSTKQLSNLLVLVLYVVDFISGLLSENVVMLPVLFFAESTFLVGLIFITEERYGLNKLLGSFSIKRRDIVRGRYVFSIWNGLLMMVLCLSVIYILYCLVDPFFEIKTMLFIFCIGFLLYSFVISIQIPLYFKYSASSTKLILLIPLLIFILAIPLLNSLDVQAFIARLFLCMWDNTAYEILFTAVISAFLLFLSYFISCRLYNNLDL